MSTLQNLIKHKPDIKQLEQLFSKAITTLEDQPVVQPMVSTGHDRGTMSYSGKVTPSIVNKTWGNETIYQNNSEYCSKLLVIKPLSETSLHFHLEKHETLVVTEGILAIDYIDKKEEKTIFLNPYQAFTIAPGLPHRLRALEEEVKLIESSMQSFDDDSIRIS